MAEKTDSIDVLRDAVTAFGWCNETFNQRFRVEDLLIIRRCWLAAEWDFFPDQWTQRQVKEALKGIVPRWTTDEKPDYSTPKKVA